MEDRKSCSKTDPDATFMGMKEDPLRNHHLKAVRKVLGRLPPTVVADAGYGSEENMPYDEAHDRFTGTPMLFM